MKKVIVIMTMLFMVILQGCGGGGGGSSSDGSTDTGENTSKSTGYYSGTFGTGEIAFTLNTGTNAVRGIISKDNSVSEFNSTITNGQFSVDDVGFDISLALSVAVSSNGAISGTWSNSSTNGSISGNKISVNGNSAPVIKGTPATSATVGTSYSFTPYAVDPNGDTVTFSVSNKPSWANFSTSTGVISGTPTVSGTFTNIVISAIDGNGGVSSLPAFTINVSDPVTTSTNFSRNSTTEIVTNINSGVKWQDNSAAKTQHMSWYDAGTYCSNLSLGGLTGWRLPNRAELQTLIDNTRAQNPYIDVVFVNVPSSFAGYWTSEESSTTNAYYYNFGTTVAMSNYTKTSTLIYVRCVYD